MTDSPAYEQRKHHKIAQYRAAGVHVIEWTPPDPLPDLTPAPVAAPAVPRQCPRR